jgi:hypothetical protein
VAGWRPRGCGPGHELVDARGRPEVDEPGEDVSEVGLRIDAVHFAGLDQRSDAGPVLGAFIVAGEERVLFDGVGVELDAAVVEEAGGQNGTNRPPPGGSWPAPRGVTVGPTRGGDCWAHSANRM